MKGKKGIYEADYVENHPVPNAVAVDFEKHPNWLSRNILVTSRKNIIRALSTRAKKWLAVAANALLDLAGTNNFSRYC